jgi:hypothetical protein
MSGGYFDYEQYKLSCIADKVQQLILNEESTEVNSWGDPLKKNWSKDTLDAFVEAVFLLRLAEIYAQRIDWLVSGDDSEESFKKRLGKELHEIGSSFKMK